MALKRPPDGILYACAVLGFVALAIVEQERANAPAAPPPIAEGPGLGPTAAMRPSTVRKLARAARERATGTAFSVSDSGVWLTARHVVNGCRRAAVLVSPSRGVEAKVSSDPATDVAVLATDGGAPPLPLAPSGGLKSGLRGYHPGFPQGAPGEVTSRLVGPYRLRRPGRGEPAQAVLAWAEVGRTDGLKGRLSGLSGAPVLDGEGRVIGVTLAESPRRGRIYAAPPAAIQVALTRARLAPASFAEGRSINRGNYGRVADALRRDLRIAPVACLD